MSEGPLLLLEAAAVTGPSGPLGPPLSLSAEGPRVALLGHVAPALAPLFGRARLSAGRYLVMGEPPSPELRARLGLAPLDPVLPLGTTPVDYVRFGARLAGLGEAAASQRAAEVCQLAGLGAFASRPLAQSSLILRRLCVLAQAVVADPPLLVAESPFDGLDPASAAYVIAALGRLTEGRAAIVSGPLPEPGSPAELLARGASEAWVLAHGTASRWNQPAPPPAPPPPEAEAHAEALAPGPSPAGAEAGGERGDQGASAAKTPLPLRERGGGEGA